MASYTHGQGTLRPPIQAFPIASSLSHRHGLGSTPSHYISMNGPVQVTASNAPTEMSENSTELPDNSGSEILAHPGLYPSGHQIIQWTFRTTTETASYYYNGPYQGSNAVETFDKITSICRCHQPRPSNPPDVSHNVSTSSTDQVTPEAHVPPEGAQAGGTTDQDSQINPTAPTHNQQRHAEE